MQVCTLQNSAFWSDNSARVQIGISIYSFTLYFSTGSLTIVTIYVINCQGIGDCQNDSENCTDEDRPTRSSDVNDVQVIKEPQVNESVAVANRYVPVYMSLKLSRLNQRYLQAQHTTQAHTYLPPVTCLNEILFIFFVVNLRKQRGK